MAKVFGLTGKIILLAILATLLPSIIISVRIPDITLDATEQLSSEGLSGATTEAFRGHLVTEIQSQIYQYSLYTIFLALLLGLFFAGSITKPLKELSDFAGRIAKGDISVEIKESKSKDEIGTLTNNFRKVTRELSDSYDRIEETRGFLRNIVECSGDAIVTTNLGNLITSWNRGAEELYGFTAEEMIGTSVLDLYPEELKEKRREWLDKLIKGEVIRNQRTTIYTKGGPVNISLTLSTLKDPQGNPIGTVGVSKDITREVVGEEKLKVAYERLRELDRLKDDFLSTVTHELRTPLTVIHGAVDLMSDVKPVNLTGEQRELIKLIDEESIHLNNIIGDILEVSKEKEKLRVNLKRHSIEEIVNEVLDAARPRAKMKKIQIILDIKEGAPLVLVDRDRIKRAISNLVENAVKFNREEGKITVKVDYKGKHVNVSVMDTGIGIPESELDRVFDKFYRIERGTSRKYPGTGLGLAMIKNIIETHGGKIWVKSTLGEGTEFMFTLPAE